MNHIPTQSPLIYVSSRIGVKNFGRKEMYTEYEVDENTNTSTVVGTDLPLELPPSPPDGDVNNPFVLQPEINGNFWENIFFGFAMNGQPLLFL